ncbi:MAG: NAD(P)-dependent oxidoreductase [Solirubrobacterales bacterium]
MNNSPQVLDLQTARVGAYFSHVASHLPNAADVKLVVIGHGVSNTPHFLDALGKIAEVALVLIKPKSSRTEVAAGLKRRFPTSDLDRDEFEDSEFVAELFRSHDLLNSNLVLVDIGGYFAPCLNGLNGHVTASGGRILGAMEGTENGWQLYEKHMPIEVPVVSVARSPLKLPEDYLVGSSIVFSIEAVLRNRFEILQTRQACVVGYGKVGSSVAAVLRGRGVATVIHDNDPVAMAEASARGFPVSRRLDRALANADLVVYATGNRAFGKAAMSELRDGAIVAGVTSADSEIVADDIAKYSRHELSNELTEYRGPGNRRFFLVNDGNAANFLHGAVIGPAIQLIEGEKLSAVSKLATADSSLEAGKLTELDYADRKVVAETWNEHFLLD